MTNLREAALDYAKYGYKVFPCVPGGKAPLTKNGFKDATSSEEQISKWWRTFPNANIGMPMDGLVAIDVDGAANPWLAAEPERWHEIETAPLSITPRGGRHHIFLQPPGKDWRNTAGKLAPQVDTRGNGGYIVVPPSVVGDASYRWANTGLCGPSSSIPEPPAWLVAILDGMSAPNRPPARTTSIATFGDVERRATAYLSAMPASISGAGGHAAAYAAATTLVHGFGLETNLALEILLAEFNHRCQPPWSEKELRHKVADAASKPHDLQFGWLRDQAPPTPADDNDVDLSALLAKLRPTQDRPLQRIEDPGLAPEELLRVPGFISEVMDYCLDTAPYPNQVMAFCGALSLQAFLAGRKVRDPGDNRTNIYLLGLAHAGVGKDAPRKVNTRIITEAGIEGGLGQSFASGEGIQDALFQTPSMLFQTDEIDGMLQAINKAKDARHENIMSTLLTIYSASNSIFPMRRKAGKEAPGIVDQPHLVIFGTAIPPHYYAALSERMLTNGFFARMIIIESGPRSHGQEPKIRELPVRILKTAHWWDAYRPRPGNLEAQYPGPTIVDQTEEARGVLVETREEVEAEYAKAESAGDPVGTTVWGRVSEQVRKLALIYAISENHEKPLISSNAVTWARVLMMHQTRRMLSMAQLYVADNPFHAECLKLLRKLQEAPGKRLTHSVLLKRMKCKSKGFRDLVDTLTQRGEIEIVATPSAGRPTVEYALSSFTLTGVKEG